MKKEDAKSFYDQLFSNDAGEEDLAGKAKAFDQIAEKYYFGNFGSVGKSDLDVLMFSIYIERILDKSQDNFSTYSDYTLSKQLGITQTRISNLKVKKELQYPYEDFDWRKRLADISKNAIYDEGRIKLHIPDRNLYLEIKNAIEESGGFIETQLNPSLLQIRPEYFIDLLMAICDEDDREQCRKRIKTAVEKNEKLNLEEKKYLEHIPLGQALKNQAPELISSIIAECIPCFKGPAKIIIENVCSLLLTHKK